MEWKRDLEHDVAYLDLRPDLNEVRHSHQVNPPGVGPLQNIILDFDGEGRLLGIELLGASKHLD